MAKKIHAENGNDVRREIDQGITDYLTQAPRTRAEVVPLPTQQVSGAEYKYVPPKSVERRAASGG